MDINSVVITGTVKGDVYSHSAHDSEFRQIKLESERKSGTKDMITIIYQEKKKTYEKNQRIKVTGSLRSRREDGRLIIYVYADEIELYEGEEINELILEGYVCSEPYYKEIPGRKLTQMLMCSNNLRRAYASVIIWEKTNLEIGQKLVVCGRLQSRTYGASEKLRQVNEISAYRAE